MTARSQKVKEAWKIFQVRRSGLMHPSVGIALGPGRAYRGDIDPPTASILYITVVSILDEATCSRLTNKERREHDTLHKRLKLLRDRKELLDYDALKTIRKCRNELAHKAVTLPIRWS